MTARVPVSRIARLRGSGPARTIASAMVRPAPPQIVNAVSSITAWGRISDQYSELSDDSLVSPDNTPSSIELRYTL